MKAVSFNLPSIYWLIPVIVVLGLIVWQRKLLRLTPLNGIAFMVLLIALLNPSLMLQPQSTDKADFNLQIVKPRVLLVEYGSGQTFLGTVLGKDSPANTDIVSPDDLPMITDMLKKYDIVALHTNKNMQVYTDYLTDWNSWPNRSKLESVFSDYGVVFENGTQTLPSDLSNYGLIVLACSDVKQEDASRLTDYVNNGGRVLVLLHAGGGKAVNPPGNDDPYCILYHHPPYGDRAFPAEWLQRNTSDWLMNTMGLKSMENICCIYGKMVVDQSDLTILPEIYSNGTLYPNANIDGKEFDKLDWTTAFIDYDPAWQPILTIDTKYSEEPTGHGTPITVPVQGKAVAIARQYGNGKVFVFGYGSVNYGTNGIPPSMLLAAAPYIGSVLSYDDNTIQALTNYAATGGNLLFIGPSMPQTTGKLKLTDLLPVNITGPQSSVDTPAVFRDQANPVLKGLSPFIVSHYRLSALKPNGEAPAVDGKNNPVLATSYYGLGRVIYYLPEIPAAVTSNNTAPPQFWQRMVSWLSPAEITAPSQDAPIALRTGKQVPISIGINDDYGKAVQSANVSCVYTSPEGVANTANLKEKSPGIYSGQLSLETPGNYQLTYYVRANTVMKTDPISIKVVPSGSGEIEKILFSGIAFLDGYHSSTPLLMKLSLWQFLVVIGACLLCFDWVVKISHGKL